MAHVSQYSVIGRIEKLNRPGAEYAGSLSHYNDACDPVEERVLRLFLRNHIDGRVTIHWVLDQRGIEFFRLCRRKPSVPASAPLHRSPHSISVAQFDVVTHADFIAVINVG